MKTLNVLYDGKCGLCTRMRVWIEQQPAYVAIRFIPLQAYDLEERFPGIGAFHPDQELVVVSDEGEVWQGERAWILCLWALKEYREWAQRLARPALLPLARRACLLISQSRHGISRLLWQRPDKDLGRYTREPRRPNFWAGL